MPHDKIVFPMLSYLTLLLYTGEPLSNKVFWFVTMFVSSHNSFQSLRSPLSGPEWGLFLVLLQPIFSKFINNITWVHVHLYSALVFSHRWHTEASIHTLTFLEKSDCPYPEQAPPPSMSSSCLFYVEKFSLLSLPGVSKSKFNQRSEKIQKGKCQTRQNNS